MPYQHLVVCMGKREIGHIKTAGQSKFCAEGWGAGHNPKSWVTLNTIRTQVTKGRASPCPTEQSSERKETGCITAPPPEQGNNDRSMVERGAASRIICCSQCVCVHMCVQHLWEFLRLYRAPETFGPSCFLVCCCNLTPLLTVGKNLVRSLQQREAICSQNMRSEQIQSWRVCQTGVTEPRPLPVIINLFAVLYLSSHFTFSSAAPFSGLLGDTEMFFFPCWRRGDRRRKGNGGRPGENRVP